MRADRQTNKHTYMLITILRTSTGSKIMKLSECRYLPQRLASAELDQVARPRSAFSAISLTQTLTGSVTVHKHCVTSRRRAGGWLYRKQMRLTSVNKRYSRTLRLSAFELVWFSPTLDAQVSSITADFIKLGLTVDKLSPWGVRQFKGIYRSLGLSKSIT